jgi:hypothetical protein
MVYLVFSLRREEIQLDFLRAKTFCQKGKGGQLLSCVIIQANALAFKRNLQNILSNPPFGAFLILELHGFNYSAILINDAKVVFHAFIIG